MDRKYSVAEICEMRDFVASLKRRHNVPFNPAERANEVEIELRTYLMAGISPEELAAAVREHEESMIKEIMAEHGIS